jgi:hypothetical protein
MIAMLRLKSGEERLKMGASMFDMARHLVIASLAYENTDENLRTRLFLRFYNNDFDAEKKKRIIRYLKNAGGR